MEERNGEIMEGLGAVEGGRDEQGSYAAAPEAEPGPEEMERLYGDSLKHINEGEIVKGKIIQIDKDSVLVDVGYKSEGVISLYEFEQGGKNLKVGDEVEIFLEAKEDSEGFVVLSKEKANRIRIWEKIEKIYEENGVVEGVVTDKIRGGLTVNIGIKAFLPGSQIDLRPVRNMDKLLGEKFQMRIIKMNRKKGNIVLSRRLLLEEERARMRAETLAQIEEGKVMEGTVKNITDYGVFVDLGGIDGLLHITDMSWGRVSHPSEMFGIGDKIKVMILRFDPETERVSLGHKQIFPDPWIDVDKKYPVGTRLKGRVVSLADYGAFVELEEGVEGLVHVSEMSWTKKIRHPSKVVNVGDEVDIVVLNLDKENKRISLGIKQTEPNPWDIVAEKYPPGSRVVGKIRNLTDFGAFLALDEGVDGLIHISDISWTQRVKHPSDVFKKGQTVEAVVLSVDKESERLSLGVKQITPDPWTTVEGRFKVGHDVKVEIVKLTNFGAFAELEEGIEGLIHLSELSSDKVATPEEVVKVGDRVTVKIIKVDVGSRKIGLSIKAYERALTEEGPSPAEDSSGGRAETAALVETEEEIQPSEQEGEGEEEEERIED